MSIYDLNRKVCPLLSLAESTKNAGSGMAKDYERHCLGETCAWYREANYEYIDGGYKEYSYCGLAGKPEEDE